MKHFLYACGVVTAFAAGWVLSSATKPFPKQIDGFPAEFTIYTPTENGTAVIHKMRAVRYCPMGGEPVELAAASGNTLWRLKDVFPGVTIYAEPVTGR